MRPNIETFLGCDSDYERASVVLYGAPFDSTTSFRPGARFGPSAMRHESFGLETYSPYQDRDLGDCAVFDSGDLELCFGSAEMALADIEARAEEILRDGKFPLLLGGEHLVTLGAVRAAGTEVSLARGRGAGGGALSSGLSGFLGSGFAVRGGRRRRLAARFAGRGRGCGARFSGVSAAAVLDDVLERTQAAPSPEAAQHGE